MVIRGCYLISYRKCWQNSKIGAFHDAIWRLWRSHKNSNSRNCCGATYQILRWYEYIMLRSSGFDMISGLMIHWNGRLETFSNLFQTGVENISSKQIICFVSHFMTHLVPSQVCHDECRHITFVPVIPTQLEISSGCGALEMAWDLAETLIFDFYCHVLWKTSGSIHQQVWPIILYVKFRGTRNVNISITIRC